MIENIYNDEINWQMSRSERASIFTILNNLKNNDVAIEVGSYCGGFLRILSKRFKKVYSLDIDHSNVVNKDRYTNVEFITGDSKLELSKLICQLNNNKETLSFVLIDADHEYDGVNIDLKNILCYKPNKEMILLIHDSWYSPSRKAICDFNWNDYPHVHLIDTDFCTGDLMPFNIYMGGLALVLLSPHKRTKELIVTQSQDYMYRKVNELLGNKI